MRYYPLFLDIFNMKCLVLGAGKVGRRKIATLQKAGALQVLVIDESLKKGEFERLYSEEYLENPRVCYEQRAFCETDLVGIRLAFAATSSTEENGLLAKMCHEENIFCNVIEDVKRGDFIVPSHIEHENLIIALSTSGTSPALAKALKEDLESWLALAYAPFLNLMEHIRNLLVQKEFDDIDRTIVFREFVQNPLRGHILTLLAEGKRAELESIIKDRLPLAVCEKIEWGNVFFNYKEL